MAALVVAGAVGLLTLRKDSTDSASQDEEDEKGASKKKKDTPTDCQRYKDFHKKTLLTPGNDDDPAKAFAEMSVDLQRVARDAEALGLRAADKRKHVAAFAKAAREAALAAQELSAAAGLSAGAMAELQAALERVSAAERELNILCGLEPAPVSSRKPVVPSPGVTPGPSAKPAPNKPSPFDLVE